MINQRRRDEVENLCRIFVQGNNHQLHELICNYRHILARIDIQQMQLSQDTLDCSFRSICGEVFTHIPVNIGYIIAVLGFAEAIHNHHCSFSWYNIDMLTNSLVNVLEDIDFHPDQLTPFYCVIL